MVLVPPDHVACAAWLLTVNASAVAVIGEGDAEALEAPAEMTVARASVPAAAAVIAFERLVDKKEGRGICRAKTKTLDSSRRARSTSTSDATLRALGEARQASARGLDAGAGRRTARDSHGLAGEVLDEPSFRFVLTMPCNNHSSQRHSDVTSGSNSPQGRQHARNTVPIRGFLLLNGNYCELGHPAALIRKSERYVVVTLRKEITCLRYTLRL